MGAKYGDFKFEIEEKIDSFDRNLIIIDREYRQKIKNKRGKQFTANEKYYKYKCLNCGNEDWVLEYSLVDKKPQGCNACCKGCKKVVPGVNDITSTAQWMVPLIRGGSENASKYMKNSKQIIEFVCPDCGAVHLKSPMQVYANNGLSCPCGDGWSYPNKFMYYLLKQIGVNFELEKSFPWSAGRIYDDFIMYNDSKIIVEMHGNQHFNRAIIRGARYRTVEEEKENDRYKKEIALENGIDFYFSINASNSNSDFIRKSISDSGLLSILNADVSEDMWIECEKFATSNLVKEICKFKNDNPDLTLHEIAEEYKIAYKSVLKYVKQGVRLNWCKYQAGDDLVMLNKQNRIRRKQKPIHCITNDTYYRTANIAASCLSVDEKEFFPRQMRQAITRGSKYLGYEFEFISQHDFNENKDNPRLKTVGDYFPMG